MLAITYAFDRVSYTKAKAPFIQNIIKLAEKSIIIVSDIEILILF